MAKNVIIVGGGVAGMCAAHELAERGLKVEAIEKNSVNAGGKARKVHVPKTNRPHPEKYLLGEHGFRLFLGFYKHVVDTIKRRSSKVESIFDKLVPVIRVSIFRAGKGPIKATANFPQSCATNFYLLYLAHSIITIQIGKSGDF